jgi:hypothetical protein
MHRVTERGRLPPLVREYDSSWSLFGSGASYPEGTALRGDHRGRRGRACRRKLYAAAGRALCNLSLQGVGFSVSGAAEGTRQHEQSPETSGSRSAARHRCRRRTEPADRVLRHGARGVRSPVDPA